MLWLIGVYPVSEASNIICVFKIFINCLRKGGNTFTAFIKHCRQSIQSVLVNAFLFNNGLVAETHKAIAFSVNSQKTFHWLINITQKNRITVVELF